VSETSASPYAAVVPRPAATVALVRDAPGGLEVLLLQRAEIGDQNSGAWVFPGGLVDADDALCHGVCCGVGDAQASQALGLPANGLDHYIAAVRECFEEAGILLARNAAGQPLQPDPETAARLAALREPLARGELSFETLCQRFGLQLATDALAYIAHWITPPIRPKRFDTRFFVAALPSGQEALHDAAETVDHVWLRPVDALSAANTRRLMRPTRRVIETLGRFEHSEALMRWARTPRTVHQEPAYTEGRSK
jgi:8-oxo-dGTP pyrophosphatase MutT (NUDIX family)